MTAIVILLLLSQVQCHEYEHVMTGRENIGHWTQTEGIDFIIENEAVSSKSGSVLSYVYMYNEVFVNVRTRLELKSTLAYSCKSEV